MSSPSIDISDTEMNSYHNDATIYRARSDTLIETILEISANQLSPSLDQTPSSTPPLSPRHTSLPLSLFFAYVDLPCLNFCFKSSIGRLWPLTIHPYIFNYLLYFLLNSPNPVPIRSSSLPACPFRIITMYYC